MLKSLGQMRHELPSAHILEIPSTFNTECVVKKCVSDDIHAHDLFLLMCPSYRKKAQDMLCTVDLSKSAKIEKNDDAACVA